MARNVSATPSKLELEQTGGEVAEQVIRPTGLIDPEIEVHPAQGQVPHLLAAIKERVADDIRERVIAAAEAARQADVYPGTRREVLRRYRLDYAGWDR